MKLHGYGVSINLKDNKIILKDGMSMCQEITIAKITVKSLADFCIRSVSYRFFF